MPGRRRGGEGWFGRARHWAREVAAACALVSARILGAGRPRAAFRACAGSWLVVAALLLAAGQPACRSITPTSVSQPAPSSPSPTPIPEAASVATPPHLVVRRASEEVVVAAWAEPARLAPPGGQVQILVRAQRRDGRPYPGVQVRLSSTSGSLLSRGRVLVTDASGMTRDRLRLRATAAVVLNAGGTRYKFDVPVADAARP